MARKSQLCHSGVSCAKGLTTVTPHRTKSFTFRVATESPWSWADAAAGILVACWLALGAYEVARESADHLMDRELPDEDRARIEALARDDPAILGVHDLRTRSSGPFIHIQFHADLDPEISLKAAHEVVVAAEARIRTAYPAADVIIHPDPADGVDPHGHDAFLEGRAARAR